MGVYTKILSGYYVPQAWRHSEEITKVFKGEPLKE